MAFATTNLQNRGDVIELVLDQPIRFFKSKALAWAVQLPRICYPVERVELMVAVPVMHTAQQRPRPQTSRMAWQGLIFLYKGAGLRKSGFIGVKRALGPAT
jgi:hypothetical protein